MRLSSKQKQQIVAATDWLGWVCVVLILIYYGAGGYRKILMLGSSIDPWVYRIIGYDDTSRFLTAALEVPRRVLMPLILLMRFSLHRDGWKLNKITTWFFTFAALMAAVVNLDRGPIFLYLVLALFYFYFGGNASLVVVALVIALGVAAIGVVGAFVTFLQYNKTDVSIDEVLQNVRPILLDRIILDPVRTADTYVFGHTEFDGQPLLLKYSRLGALVGRTYVGTEDGLSLYVTPVGAIADIYRNFGMWGMALVGFAQGVLFMWFQRSFLEVDNIIKVSVGFLLLALCMYLMYGGIFSQGPFALMTASALLLLTFKRRVDAPHNC